MSQNIARKQAPARAVISVLDRLRLAYGGDAEGAPAYLVLKRARRDGSVSFVEQRRKEAAFYAEVAPHSPKGVLVPCFETVSLDDDARHHVLLADLSETHHVLPDWPVVRTDHCGLRAHHRRLCEVPRCMVGRRTARSVDRLVPRRERTRPVGGAVRRAVECLSRDA